MFKRMAAGDIKAVWIICTTPDATVPNRASVLAGLDKAELVICQDAFLDCLYYSPYAYATTDKVQGFHVTPLGNYHTENISLAR